MIEINESSTSADGWAGVASLNATHNNQDKVIPARADRWTVVASFNASNNDRDKMIPVQTDGLILQALMPPTTIKKV